MPRRWPIAMLACAVLTPAAIMGACTRQMPGPAVCSQRLPCGKGNTCVLGRCRVNGTMPTSLAAPRHSTKADRFVVIADGEARGSDALDGPLQLGMRDRDVTLLLSFKLPLPEGKRIQRALIEIAANRSCPAVPNLLSVELARLMAPWRETAVRGNALPRTDLPMFFAPQRVNRQPLRLDVTELAQRWYESATSYDASANADGGVDSGAGDGGKPASRDKSRKEKGLTKTAASASASSQAWGAVPPPKLPGDEADNTADEDTTLVLMAGNGVALRIFGDGAQPSCFSSARPRLDVFLWPDKKDAGTDAGDAGSDAATDASSMDSKAEQLAQEVLDMAEGNDVEDD